MSDMYKRTEGIVEAWQYDGGYDTKTWPDWLREKYEDVDDEGDHKSSSICLHPNAYEDNYYLVIDRKDDKLRADRFGWITKDANGRISVYTNSEFKRMFTPTTVGKVKKSFVQDYVSKTLAETGASAEDVIVGLLCELKAACELYDLCSYSAWSSARADND